MLSRRSFIQSSFVAASGALLGLDKPGPESGKVMTVKGPLAATAMGQTLIHEHILVDFIGADQYNPDKWNKKDVIQKMLPYLQELKATGCKTLIDCTPNYLGRDVVLLEQLSSLSGLNILTNTGYYGGSVNKFLPAHAFTETAQQLADRWTREFIDGIDNTKVRPGFIKISVNDKELTEISKKLVHAAALCHLKTGLTIASHTGPARPAFEEIEILKQAGVAPSAFIWVHAQNEQDWNQFLVATQQGAWVSLDALRDENVEDYVEMLTFLKNKKALHYILISHDAGWYEPEKVDGGKVRGYTTMFVRLLPALKQAGFTDQEIAQLLQHNPAKAFAISVRRIKVK